MTEQEMVEKWRKVFDASEAFHERRRQRIDALKVGGRVRASKQITEGGAIANPDATFPQPGYIHAERGDIGTIEHVESDGAYMVRFDHTGTSTVVLSYEIEIITPANKYLEEIHDENGPTGQFVDVREIRMDDEHFYPDVLDDGIRETVLWLRANGFRTIDSGDGKKGHPCAHSFPNVWMVVEPAAAIAETDRLMGLLCSYNIAINGKADDCPTVDMTYTPGQTEPALIRMFYVDDALLTKHGVIAKTAPAP